MRKTPFINGEYYHIYNRGVEGNDVFKDDYDMQRFFQSMTEFNTIEPIGSIYEQSFKKRTSLGTSLGTPTTKLPLVNFVVYCLNPNHYHFILQQVSDKGIEKFIQRLGGGYTRYINEKYNRSGVLFQGKFKAVHVDSDSYLLHLSVYVNLNYKVHRLGSRSTKSSFDEYIKESQDGICEKSIILEHFESKEDYKKYAEDSVSKIMEDREYDSKIDELLIE